MKRKAWYVKFPADVYALGPMRFSKPVDEREAREQARQIDGVTRLQQGTQVWPA